MVCSFLKSVWGERSNSSNLQSRIHFRVRLCLFAGAIEDCALGVAVLALNALPQAESRWGTRTGTESPDLVVN